MVLRIPTYVPVDEGVVSVFEDAKLKQYCVPVERSFEGKLTIWPETAVAVPIPGNGVAPEGRLVVVTIQFEAVEFTVKPDGNITCIEFSTPVVEGVAHIMPPVVLDTASRSRRIKVSRSPA